MEGKVADYVIQTQRGNDLWKHNAGMLFKHRFHSTKGNPCAQPAFEKLSRKLPYVRLVRWNGGEATVIEETR